MKEFYVICDNIRSLENIGSIFRTADALGVSKIFLCGISGVGAGNKINQKLYYKLGIKPQPPSKGAGPSPQVLRAAVSKTALGAEKTVPFEHHWQTWRIIDKLKKQGVQIVALEQGKRAVDCRRYKPKFPLALIIGNEVKGISEKILKKTDKIIFLPMLGQKESLNVSVAFGVAGYYIKFKN
ncbi:MAG: TrmH family RNA methyltransferase [bacterium]